MKYKENWVLIIVLISSGLLFRLVQIFGTVSASNCVGYSYFWVVEYASGLSILEGFFLIFLLCSAWALIDLILVVKNQHYKSPYAVALSLSTFIISVAAVVVTFWIYSITPDIEVRLEKQRADDHEKIRWKNQMEWCEPKFEPNVYKEKVN